MHAYTHIHTYIHTRTYMYICTHTIDAKILFELFKDSFFRHVVALDSSTQVSGRGPKTGWVSTKASCKNRFGVCMAPIVSIVVPFFGLTSSILRILNCNPKKELQWRLKACCVGVSGLGVWGSGSRVKGLFIRVLGVNGKGSEFRSSFSSGSNYTGFVGPCSGSSVYQKAPETPNPETLNPKS